MVHYATHTILGLLVAFVSVCHWLLYYGDNWRQCMILLSSASRIVCCGLYGLPGKLLEKGPAALVRVNNLYVYTYYEVHT